MAVLSLPRFLLPTNSRPRRARRPVVRCWEPTGANRSAIIWFKQDLRVDDHWGLLQAASYRSLVPLYVFDHRILTRYSDDTLQVLLPALEDLRKSLKKRGSNLMVKFGKAEEVILELIAQVMATNVFVEEEVEYHLRRLIGNVEKALEEDGRAKIVKLRTGLYDIKESKSVPPSYEDFEKLGWPVTSPFTVERSLSIDVEVDWGSIPTWSGLKEFMSEDPFKLEDSWASIKSMSAETLLQKNMFSSRGIDIDYLNNKNRRKKNVDNSVFVTNKQNVVGGGTDTVLNALAAYLRYLEGTARGDWQEIHEKLREAETRDGASFSVLFGTVLGLGIVSRRRVYFEAIKYEKERNAGFISPFGYSAVTVAAAVDAVRSMEWYELLAMRCQRAEQEPHSIRIWRWNGFLIQYTFSGLKGPAVLLVHGFGAFLEHFRDNIGQISDVGNRVWALTLLGFGKSEKPNIIYTELLWAELLRDFICEVVQEPVHLVGNSVGGYIASIFACCWPVLVKSVVLINSAGEVVPDCDYLQITSDRQTSGPAKLGARLLLFFLRSSVANIVKSCYPTKPERADDWLIGEMLRASSDPGGLAVLESVFGLNLSLPINYLLKEFKGEVLVILGLKDPIADAKSKVAIFKKHCSGFTIKELDAGHCPHDELPDKVNPLICEWIAAVENRLPMEPLYTR